MKHLNIEFPSVLPGSVVSWPGRPMKMTSTVRIALIGASGVGKTSLIRRFIDGRFDLPPSGDTSVYVQTIAPDFRLAHTDKCRMQLWDTPGVPHFAKLVQLCTRDVDAVIYAFEETRWHTLEQLEQPELAGRSQQRIGLLVGCKVDLGASQVEEVRAQRLALAWGLLGYHRVSAKSGFGVMDAFNAVADAVIRTRLHEASMAMVTIIDDDEDQELRRRPCHSSSRCSCARRLFCGGCRRRPVR